MLEREGEGVTIIGNVGRKALIVEVFLFGVDKEYCS